MEPTKALPRALFVVRFPCKTFAKLLKFTLRNTLLRGLFLKKIIYPNKKFVWL